MSGGSLGSGAEIGIAVLHDDVDLREVKVPEFLDDLPGGSRKGMDSIRIVFTKLCQNTVLVGGMAANVNRFQFRNTPNQKVCTGCAGMKKTLLIKGAKRRTFCTVCQPLFLKKLGEFIKKESQKPHKIRLRDSESLLLYNGGFYSDTPFIATCVHESPQFCWGFLYMFQ